MNAIPTIDSSFLPPVAAAGAANLAGWKTIDRKTCLAASRVWIGGIARQACEGANAGSQNALASVTSPRIKCSCTAPTNNPEFRR